MSRRGFINGLIAGGVMGAILAMFLGPGRRSQPQVRLMKRGRVIGERAGKLFRRAREGMEGVVERQLKR